GQHVEGTIVVFGDILGAGFERMFENRFVVGIRAVAQHAFALEQIGHGTIRTEIAAIAGEYVAHLGCGAVLVVGHAIDHDGDTVRAIALVADFLVVPGVAVAGTALDGTLDVVLRHVGRQRLVHCQPQPRIGIRIAAAHACRDGQLTNQPGEYLAAFLVLRLLAVLDIRPLAVSCHELCPVSDSPNAILAFSRMRGRIAAGTLRVAARQLVVLAQTAPHHAGAGRPAWSPCSALAFSVALGRKMYRPILHREGGFVHGFGQGRVTVHDAGDIFAAGSVLHGDDQLLHQLGDVWAHHVDTKYFVRVGAYDDLDKASVVA